MSKKGLNNAPSPDITERKRVKELRHLDEFSKTVLDITNDAVCLIDVHDFRIVGVNRTFLEQLGVKEEEVLGKACYQVTHHRSKPCVALDDVCPLLDTVASGKHSAAEHVHYGANGEKIYVEISTSPVKDKNGKVTQVVHVSRDITGRKRAEERLRESEEKYRELVNTAIDGVVSVNTQMKIQVWNQGMERIFGYTEKEMLGKALMKIIPERYKEAKEKGFTVFAGTGSEPVIGGVLELNGVRKDGTEVPIELSVSSREVGENYIATAMVRDITERKQAEWRLGERVKELQCLYGISKITERLGITLDELYQEVVNLLPASWQYPEITCARITVNGKEFGTENCRDTRWKQSSDIKVYGAKAGEVEVGYLEERPEIDEGPFLKEERLLIDAVAEQLGETTERKRAEEALRQSEENLKTYLESAPDGIYLNDLKGEFLFGNKRAEEIIGYKREELISKSFLKLNLLPVKYLVKAGKLLALNALGRPTGPDEFEMIKKDGCRIWVEITTTPIKERGDTVVIGFVRDITERKRAEQELQEKNEQLDTQNEELQSQAEELMAQQQELMEKTREVEEANRLKSEFLSSMSHELRTPLNAIIGFSELMIDEVSGKINEEQRQCLSDVLDSGQHLLNLINGILDLSKIESGKVEFKLENVALNEVIASLTRIMMPILAPRKQSLDVEIEEGLPLVYADESKLAQVLLNLVDNASKFSSDGCELKVKAVREGDWCRVSVIDNGVGIKKEDWEQVFEPFSRLDNPLTRERRGTGLGLALVKQIIERCGGRIWVESEYGRGSRFNFTLPLATNDKPNPRKRNRR